MNRTLMLAAMALTLVGLSTPTSLGAQARFPHDKHEAFFSDCAACHSGVTADPSTSAYPEFSTCAACHDGQSGPAIEWQAPEPRASSLAFSHAPHDFGCNTCHTPGGEENPGSFTFPEPETCLGCHAPQTEHMAAECSFCHAPVTDFRLTHDGNVEPFHGPAFLENHGPAAASGQPDCYSCHAENTCTQCHDGMASPEFHPTNFVLSHSTEAYGRVSDCTSCHNSEGFCRECHLNLGMEGGGGFVAPFHDNQAVWILSHPQAARQDLESCVSCHQQNDCLRCHSASAGMRVSPHGPGFRGSSISDRNQAMCRLCHTGGGT